MKVSEMPYQRITVEKFKEQAEKIIAKIKAAKSAEDLKAARDEYNKISEEVDTAASLANCRFTLNTRDEFYNAEMDYSDNAMPLFSEIENEYKKAMLDSPHRADAEKLINPRVFKGFEMSLKTFSPEVIEDLQAENALVTKYSKMTAVMSAEKPQRLSAKQWKRTPIHSTKSLTVLLKSVLKSHANSATKTSLSLAITEWAG